MNNTLTVAWATPVDTATLGARLDAYIESKSSITTLRACIQHSSLPRLPEELIEIITVNIQQWVFEASLREWERFLRCCSGRCTVNDHLEKEVIEDWRRRHYSEFRWDFASRAALDDDFEPYLEDRSPPVGEAEHDANIAEFRDKIINGGSSGYAKYLKVFKEDFGLEVRYEIEKDYNDEGSPYMLNPWTVCAYILQPSTYTTMKNSKFNEVYGMIHYRCSMIIDPTVYREPSATEEARFSRVMREFSLQPRMHPSQFSQSRPTSDNLLERPSRRSSRRVNRAKEDQELGRKAEENAAALSVTKWPKLMVLCNGERDVHGR